MPVEPGTTLGSYTVTAKIGEGGMGGGVSIGCAYGGKVPESYDVGSMPGLGFLGDAIDYFVFENPSEISVVAEAGWTSLFLLTVVVVAGTLWLAFRAYNARTTKI